MIFVVVVVVVPNVWKSYLRGLRNFHKDFGPLGR